MSKSTGWAAFGVIAVTGLVIASCAIASSSDSPREFIGKTYDCDNDPSESERARCDASSDPSSVSSDIADDTYPVDKERAASGVSSYECDDSSIYSDASDELCDEADLPYDEQTVYMQYEDDIIVVAKDGSGSKVDVYDYDEGYRAHSAYVGVFGWNSTRPSSTRGGGGFGGGGK